MTNLYNIKFSDLNENPDFKEMFLGLENSLKHFKIDFYLVGAIAKNVWMSGIHKKGPSRTTKDFDIAVLISTKKEFKSLKEHLIKENNFETSSENAFALIWKGKYLIDLMPFGAIENEEGRVIVDGNGFTSISVPGFYDIYKNKLQEFNIENTSTFNICSLVDIIILKIFAWNDRPELREKDITDIGEILYSYFEMKDEYIYENYAYLFDLFKEEDLKLLAANVVGKEIKLVLRNNENLLQKIIDIVEYDITLETKSNLGKIMTRYFDTDLDFNINIFKQLVLGMRDN